MQFFNEQQNRAYFRQKNLPQKDKSDLILERLLDNKPDPSLGRMGRFLDEIKGEKGDKGETGLSIKGDKGDRGEKGEPGADSFVVGPMGPQGEPGRDGIDGRDGKEILVDEKKIVKAILKLLPEVMPSREHSTQDIVKQVTKEVIEFQIEEDRKNKRKLGPLLGGGTWVGNSYTAGSGIRIVGGVITATGGGGGGFTKLLSTEVPDGTNTIFTYSQKPLYIVSGGAWYEENNGWTWAAGQATLSTPPPAQALQLLAFV